MRIWGSIYPSQWREVPAGLLVSQEYLLDNWQVVLLLSVLPGNPCGTKEVCISAQGSFIRRSSRYSGHVPLFHWSLAPRRILSRVSTVRLLFYRALCWLSELPCFHKELLQGNVAGSLTSSKQHILLKQVGFHKLFGNCLLPPNEMHRKSDQSYWASLMGNICIAHILDSNFAIIKIQAAQYLKNQQQMELPIWYRIQLAMGETCLSWLGSNEKQLATLSYQCLDESPRGNSVVVTLRS